MQYTFDAIQAFDPTDPQVVAANADITIHAPNDASMMPLAIADITGMPLPNPYTTNDLGAMPAFVADVERVAWTSGNMGNTLTSWEGLRDAAEESRDASVQSAAAAVAAAETAEAPAGEAILTAISPGGIAEDALNDAIAGKTSGANTQATLMANFIRKLAKGEQAKIVVRGDSVVYGYDIISADRVGPPSTPSPDGSNHVRERSPKPYPEAMSDCLDDVYNGAVTVENQGGSGDWVGRGYDRWLDNVGADCTVISYGINDSRAPGVPDDIRGSIEAYVRDAEKMILRDLGWGSAVVLLSPTKRRGTSGVSDVNIYRNALRPLASKYGIPLIDGELFLMNQGPDAWSDGVHLNTKGYGIMGARLAALFVGEGPDNPMRAYGGSKLLARETLDNVYHSRNVEIVNTAGYSTPAEDVEGEGSALQLAVTPGSEGVAFWSFYTETPDTVIFPVGYVSPASGETGAKIEFILDFGVAQGDNFHDFFVLEDRGNTPPAAASSIGPLAAGADYISQAEPAHAVAYLRVATPGWHTLKVRGTRTSGSSGLNIQALEFLDSRTWQHQYPHWVPLSVASGLAELSEPTQVMCDGSMVTLSMGIKPSTGQFTAGATTLLSAPLPKRYRPAEGQNFSATSQAGASMRLKVEKDGVVQIIGASASTHNYIVGQFHYRK
ncbi:SGNH/GDSL hydrolase family protein [Arthrobacter rhombi]|uniref:SGNH/GDSL hydrolase family protein n=1 Tax=Arthrobacter rhombi TaxID=71253 RepID=UPI003FD305F7